MAKEAVEFQKGSIIDVTLTEDVNVGDIIPLGDMVSVAVVSGLSGEQIAVEIEKVWKINAKTADEISFGKTVYFDSTTREITTTAESNTKAGKSISSKAAATAGFVYVKINV